MNILEKIEFLIEKTSVFTIKKTEKQQQIAVALGKEAILKKHTTSVPATLLVLKGEIEFKIENKDLLLTPYDVLEIPVDVVHEVVGKNDKNLFLITKEL